MQLKIYNSDMLLLGIIEGATSIIWTRNYTSCGEFEIHIPINADALAILKLENLVYMRNKKECGVIENIVIEEGYNTSNIKITGRFAENYFSRRLIKGTFNFNGKVEEAMRQLVTLADIPKVELGTLNGFSEKIQFQATYKNTLTYLSKLSRASNIGFRLRPDFDQKKWIFETYKGIDRSENQRERSRVIFSQRDGDILKASFTSNSQNYSNVCYVGGQGEGSARQVEITGNTASTGLERREVFINGSDIEKDKLTDIEYKNALIERGKSTLNSNTLVQSLEKEDSTESNYKYLIDYDLGDIVTTKLENWGIHTNERVVTIQETYEHGQMVVTPTLGTPLASSIDWSDNL